MQRDTRAILFGIPSRLGDADPSLRPFQAPPNEFLFGQDGFRADTPAP